MSIIPKEWDVVVLGSWNRAILTPSGIAKRLFGLDAGTPVSVSIAIDAVAPHLVTYGGITVIAGSGRLMVKPDRCEFQDLQKAKEIADRALENLPETPVVAAGINVRYTCPEPLDSVQRMTQHEWWDPRLSDRGYQIVGRAVSRSLKWKDGQINLSVTKEADGAPEVLFNFHRGGGVASELRSWLSISIDEIESEVRRLLSDCMQIHVEAIEDAAVPAEV